MESLVGYESDDEVHEVENERYGAQPYSVDHSGASGGPRRRDDDTNYDDVNMDMSEEGHVLPQDSQAESEPELPQAEPAPAKHSYRDERKRSGDSGERDRERERDRDRDRERDRDRDRESERRGRRDSPQRDKDRSDRRDSRRDDKYRSDRDKERHASRGREPGAGAREGSRRGLLGDRPDDSAAHSKMPALMDLKPFGGEPPPAAGLERGTSHDARDAVSPRFVERDRRDKDKERDRERDHRQSSRRSEERRHKHSERRERSRSRSRGATNNYPPPASHSTSSGPIERRPSPGNSGGDYRPSSYKVNKKLEVMEKMGLQIKTPSGSMATAQQLRAAAADPPSKSSPLPVYYNPGGINSTKILDQVNKRKLLWANKAKNEQEEAAKWSGTRFAQDNDGKQVSKFMRLMGIKDPAAVKPEPDKQVDPIKKQEELFQAMQAQYEVARATTHTMRGVGLGFQRGQF